MVTESLSDWLTGEHFDMSRLGKRHSELLHGHVGLR